MLKKALLTLTLALQLTAVATVASADPDWPACGWDGCPPK